LQRFCREGNVIDMPTVTVQMFTGRTRSQKEDLVQKITNAVVSALGVTPDLVKITLIEVLPENTATGGRLGGNTGAKQMPASQGALTRKHG
jgi:4-oxalocrotonate tautomerase